LPVTLGNLVGGILFVAIPWFLTYRPGLSAPVPRGDLDVGTSEVQSRAE
jgi:hypothetical protein